MSVRCRFDDVVHNRAFELSDPTAILSTFALAEVPAVFSEVDRMLDEGRIVAGYVSYDAAPAFDGALVVRNAPAPDPFPLVWFAVFADRPAVPVVDPPLGPIDIDWAWQEMSSDHARSFAAIQEEILAGWTYQVNLTARLSAPFGGDPVTLYRQLVHAQRGSHHGLIVTDEFAIACGSPELFFAVADGRVTTRPMKGTMSRGRFPEEDAVRAATLLSSAKERAENLMIVDLLRNDLGRLAPYGAVETSGLFELERYPTVWQMTSTVEASIGEVRLSEIFGALFPCGSVTGAPKTSSMAIIARLEGASRGPYCGAMGWASGAPPEMEASFAVSIRTAVIDRSAHRATYGVGGAVTVGSSPEGEWDELAAKSTVLLEPATAPPLLETFRYEPTVGFVHLERHLARMAASAAHLDYRFDLAAVERAVVSSAHPSCVARVRVLLQRGGEVTVEMRALDDDGDAQVRLRFATSPISRSDRRLFHKTSDRELYEAFIVGMAEDADDVVLWNEEGEVTETTRANLFVQIGGQWWTPPIDCGLLPGIGRAIALERGEVLERVLSIEDVRTADRIEVVSSLRGHHRAVLIAVPGAVDRPPAVLLDGAR